MNVEFNDHQLWLFKTVSRLIPKTGQENSYCYLATGKGSFGLRNINQSLYIGMCVYSSVPLEQYITFKLFLGFTYLPRGAQVCGFTSCVNRRGLRRLSRFLVTTKTPTPCCRQSRLGRCNWSLLLQPLSSMCERTSRTWTAGSEPTTQISFFWKVSWTAPSWDH